MKIFSGSANPLLAEHIASSLGTTVSPVEIHVFPDGEKRIRILDAVLGEHVFIIQPASPPVDQNYMELFFLVDSAKRSGASLVTVVCPYLGYERQDHIFRSGEAVSLAVIKKMLEAVGVDRLLIFDPHSIKIREIFRIPVVHLSALPLFAKEIHNQSWSIADTVLVTPDMGGIRRIKLLSNLLNQMPYCAIEKNRNLQTGSVTAEKIEGPIRKRAIIVDDLISSGKTIVTAANLLVNEGVKDVFVFATHPVFSKDAPKVLQASLVQKVFVTDTVLVSKEKQFPKLTVLSVAQIIAGELHK